MSEHYVQASPMIHNKLTTPGKRQSSTVNSRGSTLTLLLCSNVKVKRAALLNYKREPSAKTLAALRKARNDTQWIARQCANDYWSKNFNSIQVFSVCGNSCAIYGGMKKAFGPKAIKVAPLKSASGDIITDRARKGQCPRSCAMPTSKHSSRTKEIAVTATTIVEYFSSVSLGRPLPV